MRKVISCVCDNSDCSCEGPDQGFETQESNNKATTSDFSGRRTPRLRFISGQHRLANAIKKQLTTNRYPGNLQLSTVLQSVFFHSNSVLLYPVLSLALLVSSSWPLSWKL